VKRLLFIVATLWSAAGCRPDAGPNHYANQEPFPDGGNILLPGPNPYVPGTKRLSLGAFYEGDYSDVIVIDNVTTHLFIYGVGMPQANTASLLTSPDRVEGLQSTQVVDLGLGFVGFGINWDIPAGVHDLSAWTKMHVSLKSKDSAYATLQIGMNAMAVFLDPTKYGYINDGNWHSIIIPLADYVAGGIDLKTVDAPFVFSAGAGTTGDTLLLDDFYYTAD
jgi:hypothetical protein